MQFLLHQLCKNVKLRLLLLTQPHTVFIIENIKIGQGKSLPETALGVIIMDNKNGFLTISEFAKLRGVTSETLRHYDRTGLLKPVHIDGQTGYRYYSILQYEQLGTIKELRQLGFSIDAISEYFKERNVAKSSLKEFSARSSTIFTKYKNLVKK